MEKLVEAGVLKHLFDDNPPISHYTCLRFRITWELIGIGARRNCNANLKCERNKGFKRIDKTRICYIDNQRMIGLNWYLNVQTVIRFFNLKAIKIHVRHLLADLVNGKAKTSTERFDSICDFFFTLNVTNFLSFLVSLNQWPQRCRGESY